MRRSTSQLRQLARCSAVCQSSRIQPDHPAHHPMHFRSANQRLVILACRHERMGLRIITILPGAHRRPLRRCCEVCRRETGGADKKVSSTGSSHQYASRICQQVFIHIITRTTNAWHQPARSRFCASRVLGICDREHHLLRWPLGNTVSGADLWKSQDSETS